MIENRSGTDYIEYTLCEMVRVGRMFLPLNRISSSTRRREPSEGFAYNNTNNLILNLKKKPDRRGKLDWRHKGRAILIVAQALRNSIKKK